VKSLVSEKGQVTIPKPLRDSLGLRPGTRLEFEERNGALIARPTDADAPLRRLVGILPRARTGAVLRQVRGPGWNPRLDPESLEKKA
jgi:antitoxin PrlF